MPSVSAASKRACWKPRHARGTGRGGRQLEADGAGVWPAAPTVAPTLPLPPVVTSRPKQGLDGRVHRERMARTWTATPRRMSYPAASWTAPNRSRGAPHQRGDGRSPCSAERRRIAVVPPSLRGGIRTGAAVQSSSHPRRRGGPPSPALDSPLLRRQRARCTIDVARDAVALRSRITPVVCRTRSRAQCRTIQGCTRSRCSENPFSPVSSIAHAQPTSPVIGSGVDARSFPP